MDEQAEMREDKGVSQVHAAEELTFNLRPVTPKQLSPNF